MKYWTIITGIIAITAIELMAISKGIDGAAMMSSFTAIGGLLGVAMYKIKRKETQ